PHMAGVGEAERAGDRLADLLHPRHLLLRRARDVLPAARLPRPHRQTRAVERARPGRAVLVRLAELLAGVLDRLTGARPALRGFLLRQERNDLVHQRPGDVDEHLTPGGVPHGLGCLVEDRGEDLVRAPFDALGQDVADDAATRIRAHEPLPHVLLGAGHAAAAGRLVGAVDEVGSDRPGPFGPHDGLAAGHGGHADVTAWRVAGVDAARGEAGKL